MASFPADGLAERSGGREQISSRRKKLGHIAGVCLRPSTVDTAESLPVVEPEHAEHCWACRSNFPEAGTSTQVTFFNQINNLRQERAKGQNDVCEAGQSRSATPQKSPAHEARP